MKRLLFLVFLGILALVLGVFLSSKNTTKTLEKTLISPTPRKSASPPPVVILPEAPTAVSFKTTALAASPETLPVYAYSPITISFSDALLIASRLAFLKAPLKITSGQTTTYQWSENDNVFTLDTKGDDAWISFSQPMGSRFSSPLLTTPSQGNDFLASLFPQQQGGCDIQLSHTSSGPFDGTTSTDTLTGYYYSCLTPNKKPVVTNFFSTTLASLIVNQEGVLRSLSLETLFAITNTAERQILSPDEAMAHIKMNKGILVSISREGKLSFFDKPPKFTSIDISSYSFVYLPNKTTSTLEPYYLFEGTTRESAGELLRVQYAFPALVGN